MATPTSLLSPPELFSLPKSPKNPTYSHPFLSKPRTISAQLKQELKPLARNVESQSKAAMGALLGAGFSITLIGPASASELSLLGSQLPLNEPSNALSIPTWAIHISSVVEWVTAMALVWQYGEKSGYQSWKGLSWGMVPLLGGALCACTWHFFYNSEDLEVLVALQAALTVIGNATMCLAALQIYKASEENAKSS